MPAADRLRIRVEIIHGKGRENSESELLYKPIFTSELLQGLCLAQRRPERRPKALNKSQKCKHFLALSRNKLFDFYYTIYPLQVSAIFYPQQTAFAYVSRSLTAKEGKIVSLNYKPIFTSELLQGLCLAQRRPERRPKALNKSQKCEHFLT